MTYVSKNIRRHELECNCGCGFDTMDWETVKVVQECCDYFASTGNVPRVMLIITSAARCYEYNRTIGSNDRSQHPRGRAIDFQIRGVSPARVYAYLDAKYPGKYGIGSYETFTHLDTRTGAAARW